MAPFMALSICTCGILVDFEVAYRTWRKDQVWVPLKETGFDAEMDLFNWV